LHGVQCIAGAPRSIAIVAGTELGDACSPSAAFTVATLLLCALSCAWVRGSGTGHRRQQEWTRFARGGPVIALGARAVSDVPLFQRVRVKVG